MGVLLFKPGKMQALTFLGAVVENYVEELLHDIGVEADPPVPPFRVALFVVVVRLNTVVHRVCKTRVGWEDIHGVSHTEKDFVGGVRGEVRYDERVVCLGDPDSVVEDPLAFQALDLQRCRCVQTHGATSCDS